MTTVYIVLTAVYLANQYGLLHFTPRQLVVLAVDYSNGV